MFDDLLILAALLAAAILIGFVVFAVATGAVQ